MQSRYLTAKSQLELQGEQGSTIIKKFSKINVRVNHHNYEARYNMNVIDVLSYCAIECKYLLPAAAYSCSRAPRDFSASAGWSSHGIMDSHFNFDVDAVKL